jgi:hypothetical protein
VAEVVTGLELVVDGGLTHARAQAIGVGLHAAWVPLEQRNGHRLLEFVPVEGRLAGSTPRMPGSSKRQALRIVETCFASDNVLRCRPGA